MLGFQKKLLILNSNSWLTSNVEAPEEVLLLQHTNFELGKFEKLQAQYVDLDDVFDQAP